MTLNININLRKAAAGDFKKRDADGRNRYQYGKVYFVRYGENHWAAHIFRNTEHGRESFTHFFTAGMVWVADDEKFLN